MGLVAVRGLSCPTASGMLVTGQGNLTYVLASPETERGFLTTTKGSLPQLLYLLGIAWFIFKSHLKCYCPNYKCIFNLTKQLVQLIMSCIGSSSYPPQRGGLGSRRGQAMKSYLLYLKDSEWIQGIEVNILTLCDILRKIIWSQKVILK